MDRRAAVIVASILVTTACLVGCGNDNPEEPTPTCRIAYHVWTDPDPPYFFPIYLHYTIHENGQPKDVNDSCWADTWSYEFLADSGVKVSVAASMLTSGELADLCCLIQLVDENGVGQDLCRNCIQTVSPEVRCTWWD